MIPPVPASKAVDLAAPLFEATLIPYRSLGARGFRVLMIVTAILSGVVTLPFFLLRAWPIVGFMGLDLLAVYIAFRINFRAVKEREHFRLTYFELLFERTSARGARRSWRLPAAFVRLERIDDVDYGPQSLILHSRGRSWRIAAHVGPDRKAEFANGLARGLVEARRGPRFS